MELLFTWLVLGGDKLALIGSALHSEACLGVSDGVIHSRICWEATSLWAVANWKCVFWSGRRFWFCEQHQAGRVCGFWQVCCSTKVRVCHATNLLGVSGKVHLQMLDALQQFATCRPDVVICTLVQPSRPFGYECKFFQCDNWYVSNWDLLVTSIFLGNMSSLRSLHVFGIAPSQWQHTLLG